MHLLKRQQSVYLPRMPARTPVQILLSKSKNCDSVVKFNVYKLILYV